MRLATTVRCSIWEVGNAWSLSPDSYPIGPTENCPVELRIEGDDVHGYHLVMAPHGVFTADTWHATVEEAMLSAESLFGVPRSEWKVSN
jgi:hypothetical protein